MLNLEDHGDDGPHGWLLDTYLKMLFWYDNISWKDCIDATKNLKAWLLLYWCYNRWMTLEDTTTLFYLSVFQGSIQISQKEAEHYLFLTEDQIWLKYRRWYWIRGFPETQSRIYASSCTENRVCLIADKFLFGSAFFSTAAVLFSIYDTVWYLWWCSSSLNSVSNVLMKMPWWFVGKSVQDAQTKGEP